MKAKMPSSVISGQTGWVLGPPSRGTVAKNASPTPNWYKSALPALGRSGHVRARSPHFAIWDTLRATIRCINGSVNNQIGMTEVVVADPEITGAASRSYGRNTWNQPGTAAPSSRRKGPGIHSSLRRGAHTRAAPPRWGPREPTQSVRRWIRGERGTT